MTYEAEQKPPRVPPQLTVAPKVRDLYWCDLPKDAQLPEFWKRRPVLIVMTERRLFGSVTVVPCSSQKQTGPWTYQLRKTINGGQSWAI